MSEVTSMARTEAALMHNIDATNVTDLEDATSPRGLRLLALDGGGVRGISELYILEQLMIRLQHRQNLPRPPKPCDVFDMIAGTSTGGLIAIMLGRLNMDVAECQKAYADFAEEVFGKPNHLPVFNDGIFKATNLEKVIQKIVGGKNLGTKMMNSPDQRCKVFVCSCSTADTRSCRLFRTYEHANIKDDCEIWEAARATSAAPKFFKRAEIMTQSGVRETFFDGGFGWNNPALELCEEARNKFQSRKIDCIISIGTGTQPGSELPRPKWWQTRIALYVIPTIVDIATDCGKNHVQMSRNFKHSPNTYFRFDVDGMGHVGLEEWKFLGNIKGKTMAYLQKDDINERVDRAVDALYSPLSRQESGTNVENSSRGHASGAPHTIHNQPGIPIARTGSRDLATQADPTAFVEPRYSQNHDWNHGLERTDGWDHHRQGRGRDLEGTRRAGVEGNEYERQQIFLRGLKVDPDTISNVKDQKDNRFEDTCEWIFNKPSYKDWKEGSGSKILVITAPPGQGKSVLAKYLLETFERSVTESGDFVVLDYFCQGTGDNGTTALAIMQSLLYQLLANRRYLFSLVPRQYMRSVNREQELPFEALWKIFALILKSPQVAEAYCLIDGLDECESDSERILLKSIETSFTPQCSNEAPLSNRIRFLVTSRPTARAARLGRLTHWCDIKVPDLDDDIQKVIDFRLKKMSITHELSSTVSGIISLVLSRSASGTFLWVRQSFEELEAIPVSLSESEVVKKLREIPPDMEKVYSKELRRIQQAPGTRDLAKKILDTLLFSFSPLSVGAFAAACCDWPETCETYAQLSARIADKFEDSARAACGSFIHFVNGTIQFFHSSALQYLISPGAALGSFSFDADHIHCDLARVCMRYLLLEGITIPEADENGVKNFDKDAFPLLDYALFNWFTHLRQSKKALEQYPDLLVRFFDGKSTRFKECIRPSTYLRGISPENTLDTDALVLHSLVYFRLDELISRTHLNRPEPLSNSSCIPTDAVLRLQTHINATNSDKFTALMLAAAISASSTAKTLLELGADSNLINDEGEMALHIAARGLSPDDLELVKCLITKTLSLEAKNKDGYSPFLLVNNKDIAETFLDYGVDVNCCREIDHMTLLEIAAMEGNAELVATLLHRGADGNHRSDLGWTPLYAAAQSGNAETIRLLIEQGVGVLAESEKGWNPLHAAARDGSSEAVKLLLDYGIDKNSVSLDGITALWLAAESGNVGAVEILLEAGADPEIPNSDGETPLQIAALEGKDTVVQKLLDNPVDVNTVAKDNRTPLVRACSRNHLSTVKLLIESGADKNYTHPESTPMLQLAIYNGYLEIAEYLIQAGIDLESTFKSNYTPFYVAVWKNHISIANILLEKGAVTQCRGGSGVTALHQCAGHGQLELLRRLLEDIDVNVDVKTNDKWTPLHFAAEEGHLAAVKELLLAKADINAQTSHGITPLYLAAREGHVDVVKYLLMKRADPNQKSKYGWGSLETGSRNGKYEVVDALVTAGVSVGALTAQPVSALYVAASNGHLDVVERLLNAGADIEACTGKDAWPPLFGALKGGHLDVAKILIERGANTAYRSKTRISALYLIAEFNATDPEKRSVQVDITKMFLQGVADVDPITQNGSDVIMAASLGGNLEVVELLLSRGAAVNRGNKYGSTAIHAAAGMGHSPIVNRLLEAGADVNVLSSERWSPLMCAAKNGHTEVVRRLLQEQVDPNQVNHMLETPLHAATYFYWQSTMEELLDHGADPLALDSFGKTAVEWAHLHEPTFQA